MNWKQNSVHLLLVGSLLFAIAMVAVSTQRALTTVEGTLFQIVSLGLGIVWAEQQGQRKGLPHSKSAFRRILSLYKSLARIRTHIQGMPTHFEIDQEATQALHMLDSIVEEQLSTAEDAIEDWKELLPDEDIRALTGSTSNDKEEP